MDKPTKKDSAGFGLRDVYPNKDEYASVHSKVKHQIKSEKKKELASKMYSQHRCGKCNRFGHHHDKCQKGLEKKLDSFVSGNKGAGKQTSQLSKPSYTGHYQEDAAGRIRHQSPRQVEKKGLNQY